MTTEPNPALWQHLVQWQPATAAAIAEHVRFLPDDWPLRVFGVGRPDAALALPPGATGEQFPDRAPEIAPYDEIAPLDDCPACTEAGGTCRFHKGYAAGHHEQSQVMRDAMKARPDLGLREFMLWRADVEEAEDQGQEPPAMPAPAAVPPPADRAAVLREAAAIVEAMNEGCGQRKPCASCDARTDAADALRDTARRLADEERQPETPAVTPPPALTEEGRIRAQVEVLQQDAERDRGLAKVGARCMRVGHQGLIEQGRLVLEGWRFALSTALDLGTSAPWEAIHERVKELAAGVQQQPEPGVRPARGDQFEAWLKTQRDDAADYPEAYNVADGLLDLYRLHADTSTPLGEHVCEGRVVGDCECLEQPAEEPRP